MHPAQVEHVELQPVAVEMRAATCFFRPSFEDIPDRTTWGCCSPSESSRTHPQAETNDNKTKVYSYVLIKSPEIRVFQESLSNVSSLYTFCLFLLQLTFSYSELLGYHQLFSSETPLKIFLKTHSPSYFF